MGVQQLLCYWGRRRLNGCRWSITIALGWRKPRLTRLIVQERHDVRSLANGLLLTNCSYSWWLWARSNRWVLMDMHCRHIGTRKLGCWARHQSRCSSSDAGVPHISRNLGISWIVREGGCAASDVAAIDGRRLFNTRPSDNVRLLALGGILLVLAQILQVCL
jgi:hypothetical protein